MADEKTTCPFCGEQILASAIKCKHCKEWLGGAQKNDSSMARAVSRGIKHKNASKIALKAKLLLLLGGLVLAFKVIEELAYKYFHVDLWSAPEWLKAVIVISFLLAALGFVWKFIRQYYEE